MKHKYFRLSAAATLLLGLIVYLGVLNFNLPFMTADELRYILATPEEVAETALLNGRYSSLLMIPFAEILSFIDPTNVNLIPRFISMLLLAAGVILLIRQLGFTYLSAVLLTVLVITAHEIDWQHNGLVAFFGIYNVLIAMFMLALVLDEESINSAWVFSLVLVLLIGTYASELFIGLSLCYIALKTIKHKQVKFLVRSPFFWSLAIYVSAFLIIKVLTTLKPTAAVQMSAYLVGSADVYGLDQMVTAALLYFINSLPYYQMLGMPVLFSVAIASLVLISMSGYFIKIWFGIKAGGKTNSEIIVAEREWFLAIMLFLLAVAPNLLLALQPMKVAWILSNDTVHYAFSYYTWIGLAIVCAYFTKQNTFLMRSSIALNTFTLIVVLALLGVALMSAMKNINFVNEYTSSRGKWVQMNEILKNNISKEVVVPPTYLQHQYISVVTPEQLKMFAKKYYDVRLKICSISSEIKLNEELNDKMVKLDGFSVVEQGGRWTEGAIGEVSLVEENPRINFIELDVTSIYSENKNTSVIVTKGVKKYKFNIQGIGTYRFDLPNYVDGKIKIQFLIAMPISPYTLGQSSDTRNLGIMLKNVRLGFKDSKGKQGLHVMEMCY